MTKHGEAISPISAPFPTPSTHIATTTLEPSCLWPVDLSARGCMEITPGSGASFLSSVAVKLHYTYRSSPQLSVCLSSFICLFLLSLDSGASTCFSSLFFFFILNVCVLVKFVCLFCFSFMCCLSWLLISFKCVMKQSFEQQRGLCLRPSPRSETRLRTLTKRKDTKLFNSLSRILAARSVCTVFLFCSVSCTASRRLEVRRKSVILVWTIWWARNLLSSCLQWTEVHGRRAKKKEKKKRLSGSRT